MYVGLWKSGFENKIFLVSRNFFSWVLIWKMGVKMNLRIITKNCAADQLLGFLKKSISKPYCRATAMPPVWELTLFKKFFYEIIAHSDIDLIICRFKSAKNICLKNIFLRSNWLGIFVVWPSGCFFSYWFQIALKNRRAFFFQKHFERCQCV